MYGGGGMGGIGEGGLAMMENYEEEEESGVGNPVRLYNVSDGDEATGGHGYHHLSGRNNNNEVN